MPTERSARPQSLADLVDAFQAKGRYVMRAEEGRRALDLNDEAFKKAVHRLSAKQRIVVPRRGFYVIVPLEYRQSGSPPPSWFIHDLMKHDGQPYYVGLLSAA